DPLDERDLRGNAVRDEDVARKELFRDVRVLDPARLDEAQTTERPAGRVDDVVVRPSRRRRDLDSSGTELLLVLARKPCLLVSGKVERAQAGRPDDLRRHGLDQGDDLVDRVGILPDELDAELLRRPVAERLRKEHRAEHGLLVCGVERDLVILLVAHSLERLELARREVIVEREHVRVLEVHLVRLAEEDREFDPCGGLRGELAFMPERLEGELDGWLPARTRGDRAVALSGGKRGAKRGLKKNQGDRKSSGESGSHRSHGATRWGSKGTGTVSLIPRAGGLSGKKFSPRNLPAPFDVRARKVQRAEFERRLSRSAHDQCEVLLTHEWGSEGRHRRREPALPETPCHHGALRSRRGSRWRASTGRGLSSLGRPGHREDGFREPVLFRRGSGGEARDLCDDARGIAQPDDPQPR